MAKKLTSEEQILVMSKLSQRAAAWALGYKNYQQLNSRTDVPRNDDGSYSVQDIIASDAVRTRSRRLFDDDDDEILTDRQREQKSKADLLEMRVLEKAGELVRAADVRVGLDRLADAIRGLGENFGRSPVPISGHDAQRRLNEMIEKLEWNVT